jgi:hypothetical protein
MKKISLLIAFVAFFSVASFAGTGDIQTTRLDIPTFVGSEVSSEMATPALQDGAFRDATCTLTAVWVNADGTKTTVTISSTCSNCTTQQACDKAYAYLSILIP